MIQILNRDYREVIASLSGQYSIIITDPPYNISKAQGSIKNLKEHRNIPSYGQMRKDIEQDFGEWDYQFNVSEFLDYTDRVPIIVFTSHLLFGQWIEAFTKRYEHNSFAVWHKCISGNTPIYVISNGTGYNTYIKELAPERRRSSTTPIYLPTLINNQPAWQKLISCERIGQQAVRRITFRDGFDISVTGEHRFPTIRGLLPVNDLVVGEYSFSWSITRGNDNITKSIV